METIFKYAEVQKRVTKYIALLYFLVLPIHYKTSIKILVVLLLFSLVTLYQDRLLLKDRFKKHLKGYLFPLAYFMISLIGILYSSNKGEAIRIFTDKSLVVIFAFFISLAISSIVSIKNLSFALVVGVTIACTICLSHAIYRDVTEGAYWAYHHLEFSDIIDSHPIYFGYFLNFATSIVIFYFFLKPRENTIRIVKFGAVLLIAFYLSIHFFLAGRVPVVAIIASLTVWFVFIGKNTTRFALSMLAVVAIAGVSLSLLQDKSVFVDRFVDVMKFSDTVEDTKFGGHLERLSLWKAGIGANSNILFGVGPGDSQSHLNEYYKHHHYDESFIKEQYNSHSQYVQQYLAYGLVGVIIFLGMILAPIIKAIKGRNFLAFMFFTPFLIYGISEVFLNRYQGFAFYFMFYAFFVLNKEEDLILHVEKENIDNSTLD